MSRVNNTVCHQEQVWLSTAGCEVLGVAYIAAGSAAGGGLRNVPGPGGRLLLNTKHRV